MTTRIVSNEVARKLLVKFIQEQPLPFTCEVVKGKRRSVEQNRLQRVLLNEIAEQLGDRTAEEVRGYCKLTLGVPILRAENELFAEAYDRIIKPLPYEQKIAMMMEPIDFGVTRKMTVAQKTRYLEAVHQHFTEQGLDLQTMREEAA